MDSLVQCLEESMQYPQNLIQQDTLSHSLNAYICRLKTEKDRLFDESQATVDFLDLRNANEEFRSNCATSLLELKHLLREALRPGHSDPRCRYIFIHAPHSRAALRISHSMLSFLFSYHQVMPSFLDFIFPFGKQEYAQDFHFSGLREEDRLDVRRKGIEIHELGRSGREIKLCYNLRSVEVSKSQTDLPWSVRQSAVYHSFDLNTGQSLWVNVKGNKLIKNRITEASETPSLCRVQSRSEAFSASLATHLLFCDWSAENWRWYINDLENELQALTRNALATQVDKVPTPPSTPVPFMMSPRIRTGSFPPPSRKNTGQTPTSPFTKSEPYSPTFPSRTTTLVECPPIPLVGQDSCCDHDKWAKAGAVQARGIREQLVSFYGHLKKMGPRSLGEQRQTNKTYASSSDRPTTGTGELSGILDGEKLTPPELPPTLCNQDNDQESEGNFTFSDLQRIQFIEEKSHEALLVLGLNTEVLEELRQLYLYTANRSEFPQEMKNDCQGDLVRFDKCVLGVKKDLRMLQSRTETLLHLLANRKSLLHGILQYRSVKASESFAKKAQVSADHMEAMTIEMHEIAQKTRKETVSMRVITSVTLFFLPATFIATFMSTDILNFAQGTQDFQLRGLKIYLALTLPITALTFLAWYVIYAVAKRGHRSPTLSRVVASEDSV